MAKKDKFSVLIPVYKREKPEYFDAALESVYSNTICPDEVVICADGVLTDELDEVIEKYNKRFPKITRVVRYSKNRGLGLTLHDGVLECSNEIVFRMDSDDICVADRFEKQLEFLKTTGADVIGSNIMEFDEEMKKEFGIRKVPQSNEEIVKWGRRRNPMNHMTVCFKKSKVLTAGNYQDMKGFEDYYLWVRMIHNGAILCNMQDILVKVRGGDSMVKRRGGVAYAKTMVAFEKELSKLGIVNTFGMIGNVFVRTAVSLLPSFSRKMVYGGLRK